MLFFTYKAKKKKAKLTKQKKQTLRTQQTLGYKTLPNAAGLRQWLAGFCKGIMAQLMAEANSTRQ